MALHHLLLAVAALGVSASAQAARFVYTGTTASYVVPKTGTYRIVARGGAGGFALLSFAPNGGFIGNKGGNGGTAIGVFGFSAGTTINLVVGGNGNPQLGHSGGGGGGSFVFIGDTPYVIGGGGGGGGIYPGERGQSATAIGGPGTGGIILAGSGGSPGAGWFGDGQSFGFGNPDSVGKSRPGFSGGYDPFYSTLTGGFGGGGNGNPEGNELGYGGGGGGGYTGGNGSYDYGGGYAGTSYVAPIALDSRFSGSGTQALVMISQVPEPESWSLLLVGFAGVGGMMRARRRQMA